MLWLCLSHVDPITWPSSGGADEGLGVCVQAQRETAGRALLVHAGGDMMEGPLWPGAEPAAAGVIAQWTEMEPELKPGWYLSTL